MTAEHERTRLIGQLAILLQQGALPDEARNAGLTLIGWLARRMPGESASAAGVDEMAERERVRSDEPPSSRVAPTALGHVTVRLRTRRR